MDSGSEWNLWMWLVGVVVRRYIHSCQPSRNGRDSPGILGLVPVSRWYPGCPGIYAHLTLRLSLA